MKQRAGLGRRGKALLALAILDLVYAYSLWESSRLAKPTAVAGYLVGREALLAYAALWTVTGVVLAVYAFRRWDAPGWSAAIALKVFWGGLIGVGWVTGQAPRGYLAVAIWWAFAWLVVIISGWPEVVVRRRTPEDDHEA